MNAAARRLRAQKAYSTDPDYLERMACHAESRGVEATRDAAAEGACAIARGVAPLAQPEGLTP